MIESIIGLDTLPRKSVLLIEEEIGDIKSILVQQIGYEMTKTGEKIYYLSTKKSKEEVLSQMSHQGMDDVSDLSTFYIHNKDPSSFSLDTFLQELNGIDICIIDTFSSLYLDENFSNSVKNGFNSLLKASRERNLIILLTLDMGILHKRDEAIIRSMSDGIIQLKTTYSDNSIYRSIEIPKMKDKLPYNKTLSFYLTDKGIIADRRERIG